MDHQSQNDSSGAASATPPTLCEPNDVGFRPLDPRVITSWRITSALVSAVLLVAAAIACGFVRSTVPAQGGWLLAAWLGLAIARAFLFFWYPPRAYQSWAYRIDQRVLETRSGVWFKVIQLLPLSRLQHVDLHRGPLERWLGLASLVLYTAGTHDASIVVPGLEAEEAARLRDRLVAAGGDDAV